MCQLTPSSSVGAPSETCGFQINSVSEIESSENQTTGVHHMPCLRSNTSIHSAFLATFVEKSPVLLVSPNFCLEISNTFFLQPALAEGTKKDIVPLNYNHLTVMSENSVNASTSV